MRKGIVGKSESSDIEIFDEYFDLSENPIQCQKEGRYVSGKIGQT